MIPKTVIEFNLILILDTPMLKNSWLMQEQCLDKKSYDIELCQNGDSYKHHQWSPTTFIYLQRKALMTGDGLRKYGDLKSKVGRISKKFNNFISNVT